MPVLLDLSTMEHGLLCQGLCQGSLLASTEDPLAMGHQPGPGGYGAQQTGGYGGQQTGPGSYGEQQPVHGGQPGYGNPGYGSGPMSAPQFCAPYGGFGPFVGGLG